jgi:transcriptional regulatory protein LevR
MPAPPDWLLSKVFGKKKQHKGKQALVKKEITMDPISLVVQDLTQLINDLLGFPQVIQMTLGSITESAQALGM